MLDVLIYRFYRLWRVMVLGAALPVAVVWLGAMSTGSAPYALTAIAVLVPVLHVLRYPSVWSETMTVSAVLALLLALAPTLDWDLTPLGLVWRLSWLTGVFVFLFLLLVSPVMILMSLGPKSVVEARATRVSRLDAETLRREITLAPGHQTDRITCGPADEQGRFLVSVIVAEMQTCAYEIDEHTHSDAADEALRELEFEGPGGESARAPGGLLEDDGTLRHEYYAMVHSTGPDHHELFAFSETEPGAIPDVVVARHEFEPLKNGGTKVTVSETGAKLAPFDAFGFWLTGFLEDHLTDEIDRAEGRAPRSVRSSFSRQMVVELANILLPLLGGRRTEPPAE